jgi:hypothetical protein
MKPRAPRSFRLIRGIAYTPDGRCRIGTHDHAKTLCTGYGIRPEPISPLPLGEGGRETGRGLPTGPEGSSARVGYSAKFKKYFGWRIESGYLVLCGFPVADQAGMAAARALAVDYALALPRFTFAETPGDTQ